MLSSASNAQTNSKAFFTKGTAELAKKADTLDKNIVISSFVNAINCMSNTPADKWTSDDYIRVMQSYQYAVEYSAIQVSEAQSQLALFGSDYDPMLTRNLESASHVLDQTLSSATKFYYHQSNNKPDSADFHLSAALTFLFPLVISQNNERNPKQKNSLPKAIEFASEGGMTILDMAIAALLKQKIIYNNQLRSLAKCYDYQSEIFLQGMKTSLCFKVTMLAIKSLNNIPVQDKSADDRHLFIRLFDKLAAVIPNDQSKVISSYYNKIIDIMRSFFQGGKYASSNLLTQTLNKIWDHRPQDRNLNEFVSLCLSVIQNTHRSVLLPPSEIITTLRDREQYKLFQEMKDGFEKRNAASPAPSNNGMFKRETSSGKPASTSADRKLKFA